MEYKKRAEKVREILRESGCRSLLTRDPSNIFYLTGILETEGFLLLGEKRLSLFVPGMFVQESADSLRSDSTDVYGIADFRKFISSCRKVAFISTELSYSFYETLRKDTGDLLHPLPDIILQVRMLKDPGEIRLIKKALAVNRKVFAEIGKNLCEGKRETEIAGELHLLIRKLGGRKDAFPPIVASGKNSAYPHHKSGSRRIRRNQPVIIDAGTDIGGYKSDLTRTFFCGKPRGKFVDIFKLLSETLERTVEFIRPGKTGSEIHSFAAGILGKKNLDRYFIHSIGHGVGIDVHEKPTLGPNSRDVIEKGCVVTVEPGVYIPGLGGIRLEEMLIIDR